jgi:Xaa-Pro aminopeptidase
MGAAVLAERMARVRAAMTAQGVDVLLLSLGADLPWLTGYEAMPLERLTMLVLPRDGEATLVVPRLEAPRVEHHPEVFTLRPWEETESPVGIVAGLAPGAGVAAVGDRTWAQFLVDLQAELPGVAWRKASTVTSRCARSRTQPRSRPCAGRAAADRVAAQLHGGAIPLVGRTEAEVSAELGRRLLAEGHPRSTSPSWPPGPTPPARTTSPAPGHRGRSGRPL